MEPVRKFSEFPGGKQLLYNLPVEMISEILFRLPVRSVLSCQCVCKKFDMLIRSDSFIASHVKHSITSNTNNYASLYIRSVDESFGETCDHMLIEDKNNDELTTSYVRQSNPITTHVSMIIGSCNGLFCADLNTLEQYGSCIMLWNPVTRKNRFLPKAKIDAPNEDIHPFLAFGFDPETNDYKVVRFFNYYSSIPSLSPMRNTCFNMQFEVYRMSTDSWTVFESKSIPCYGPDHMSLYADPFLPLLIDSSKSLYLKGSIHWLASNPTNNNDTCAAVVAFDLKDEELKVIGLLNSRRILHANRGKLDVFNDLIGVIVPRDPLIHSLFDIWVMNDYGNNDSWTKQYSVENFAEYARPWGYWKDNLLLMVEYNSKTKLFLYNLLTQEKNLIIDDFFDFDGSFCTYFETFVPVSYQNVIAENADQ